MNANEPLAKLDKVPLLYPALGATYLLEHLEPEDDERLADVCDQVFAWIGEQLAWTSLSFDTDGPPASRQLCDFICGYVHRLDEPPDYTDNPDANLMASFLSRQPRTDFHVAFTGGASLNHASPFSFRFWSEIPFVRLGPRYQTLAYLKVTVPLDWPLEQFEQQVCAIAGKLRLRWGGAGLMYSSWDMFETVPQDRAIIAHGRRYPGYDVGYTARFFGLRDALRTINWITWVGDALTTTLCDQIERPQTNSLVEVTPLGGGLQLKAGPRPYAGDRNRLRVSTAYAEADRMVRPIRAPKGDFNYPWDEPLTTEWLRRFQMRWS